LDLSVNFKIETKIRRADKIKLIINKINKI
jgi:hypothetical protein